ncbi:MAG: OsmC family protein [Candidatus Thermoplasmatota archaeon]|nr:OsmC family protein [Candidatus Thermoplasmatota archaeon]
MNTYEALLEKKSGFESEIKIRDFSITIDEPERLGGTNKGPNPVEVLLGSLGACLDFTGTIVAKQMGHELKDFQLEVEGDLDTRGVRGEADVPSGFQEIRVKVINIEGIPDEEIPHFLETIENRCPVDSTLEKGVDVKLSR